MALTAAQITTAFQNVLQRSPSTAELNSYVAVSSSGALSDAQVYSAIVNSAEANQYVNPVVRFYQAAFGRVPDKAGLTQQVTTLEVPGQSLKTIATGFTQSQEFVNRYGSGTTIDTAYLQALYVNVLGRTGTAAEIQNWLTTVATPGSGYTTRADVLFGFAQSVEFQADANVGTTTFLTAAAQGTATYSGALQVNYQQSTNNIVLTTGLDNILGTTGADTINATLIQPAGGATNTSTLTAGDQINGNGGTDTLRLIVDSTGGAITGLPAGVSISAITNLNVAATGGNNIALDTSAIGGLTNISLTDNNGAGSVTLNNINKAVAVSLLGQQAGGGTTLQYAATGSSDTVNIATNGTYGATTTTNAAVTLAAATGNAPANVALTGTGGLLTLTDAALKTVTINETGVTKLTLANPTSLTSVDGSASTGALTVDVSGATAVSTTGTFKGGSGNDTFRFGAGQLTGTAQTLDGGAGTDILGIGDGTISNATTGLNSAINNAKNFEVLGFTNAGGVTVDVSKVATFNTFDIISAQTGTGTAGSTAANTAGGTAAAFAVDTFTGESNGQTFIFDANVTATGGAGGAGQGAANVGGTGGAASAVSFAPALDNGANSINLTFNGVTLSATGGAGGAGVGAVANSTGGAATTVAATAFETVNIVSNNSADGLTTANVLTATGGAAGTGGTGAAGAVGAVNGLSVATAATVNISGAADFNAGAIAGNNISVNASTFTGKLTLGTGTGNDTITGGTNVNTLTLTGGADTVDITRSTSKSDVINVTSGTNTDATQGQFTSVTGFSDTATNNDRLDFLGGTTVAAHADTVAAATTVANLQAASTGGIITFSGSAAATATLAQKVQAAYDVLGGVTNTAVAFVDNGSTYVAVEANGGAAGYTAGTDIVVKLVGVTDATSLSATAGATKIVIA